MPKIKQPNNNITTIHNTQIQSNRFKPKIKTNNQTTQTPQINALAINLSSKINTHPKTLKHKAPKLIK